MRISDWSSDVCSSDLDDGGRAEHYDRAEHLRADAGLQRPEREEQSRQRGAGGGGGGELRQAGGADLQYVAGVDGEEGGRAGEQHREEIECELGRANGCTPVTTAHLVLRLLLEKKKSNTTQA